jgi:recombination protein RecA
VDIQEIQKLCKEIERKSGKGSIFTVGKSSSLDIPRWPTGIESLDKIIGGGMPKGRIVEIFGPESSGKTSLAYWLMSLHKLGLYIPIEGTYDESRAISMGVKPKQMIVHRAQYGEEAINDVIKFAKTGIPIICVDSVPACQPKEDIEKIEKDAQNEQKIGGVARLFSKTLPSIVHICEETGTTVILINQVRDKMNAMLFGEKEDTPGGRAIKFYSSVRIKVARRAWIEIPNKNPAVSSDNEKVGVIMKAKIQKSKVSNPFGEAELPFFFDRGFVSYDDIVPIRKELMKKRKEQFNV